jgi:hypothetical protein
MGDDDHAVEDEQQSGFDVVHGDCSFNGHHYGAWGRELRPGEVIVMSIDRSMTSVDSAVIQHSKDMWVSGGLYVYSLSTSHTYIRADEVVTAMQRSVK